MPMGSKSVPSYTEKLTIENANYQLGICFHLQLVIGNFQFSMKSFVGGIGWPSLIWHR